MTDINVSYEEMRSSASKLDQGRANIEEQLGSLANMINNLVQTSFKTQAASPKFHESYSQWNDGAKKAIAGLEGMSQFLNKAIQGHQELDSSLSSGMSQ
jgi:WXG100 family type VII secretion target